MYVYEIRKVETNKARAEFTGAERHELEKLRSHFKDIYIEVQEWGGDGFGGFFKVEMGVLELYDELKELGFTLR